MNNIRFSFGGDYVWRDSKIDVLANVFLYPQETITDYPHAHDPIGGGGISFNAWHSMFLKAQVSDIGDWGFFQFTSYPDSNGDPIEIVEGVLQNDPALLIVASRQYRALAPNETAQRYLPIWQFLYTAEQIELRRATA